MRTVLLIFMIVLISISAKSQTVEGTYSNKWESTSGESIEYTLTLDANGKFSFNSTRTYLGLDPTETVEAEGNWTLRDHLLNLYTQNGTNELTSNLDGNKARYISISPRNPKFNLVKSSFKFFESKVFNVKNMELIRSENSSSITENNMAVQF